MTPGEYIGKNSIILYVSIFVVSYSSYTTVINLFLLFVIWEISWKLLYHPLLQFEIWHTVNKPIEYCLINLQKPHRYWCFDSGSESSSSTRLTLQIMYVLRRHPGSSLLETQMTCSKCLRLHVWVWEGFYDVRSVPTQLFNIHKLYGLVETSSWPSGPRYVYRVWPTVKDTTLHQ